jgi:aminopeptidase N
MTEESKVVDPKVAEASTAATATEAPDSGDEGEATGQNGDGTAKKKKSKSKKIKDALTGKSVEASSSDPTKASLTDQQFQQLLEMNPALKNEVASMDPVKVRELMKNMDLSTALAGMVRSDSLETQIVRLADTLFYRQFLGRTRKTWRVTSSGRLSLLHLLVSGTNEATEQRFINIHRGGKE